MCVSVCVCALACAHTCVFLAHRHNKVRAPLRVVAAAAVCAKRTHFQAPQSSLGCGRISRHQHRHSSRTHISTPLAGSGWLADWPANTHEIGQCGWRRRRRQRRPKAMNHIDRVQTCMAHVSRVLPNMHICTCAIYTNMYNTSSCIYTNKYMCKKTNNSSRRRVYERASVRRGEAAQEQESDAILNRCERITQAGGITTTSEIIRRPPGRRHCERDLRLMLAVLQVMICR